MDILALEKVCNKITSSIINYGRISPDDDQGFAKLNYLTLAYMIHEYSGSKFLPADRERAEGMELLFTRLVQERLAKAKNLRIGRGDAQKIAGFVVVKVMEYVSRNPREGGEAW
ncbi:hypothetical protein GCM10010149_88210 [Nonomuraea roseoviolacea subsp. roseoviolacea]|uniref:hypothetical protein n=1 Tax=Nonomuraea roseoviolacea TaxID=103837 RepID=UPI0031D41EB9